MVVKEYDKWRDRFMRECGYKAAIILYGNTSDIICYQSIYMPITRCVIEMLRVCGYKSILKWDRVSGIDRSVSFEDLSQDEEKELAGDDYYSMNNNISMTPNQTPENLPQYKQPDEFFPYLYQYLSQSKGGHACVLDYSDYLFGNANALSEKERQYLAILGKSLEQSQYYDMGASFMELGNVLILLVNNNATIPPSLYLHNPLATILNVPLPGRNERERFVNANINCLSVTQDLLSNQIKKDDFIDAVDGFALKEISQIMKMSRQITCGDMSFERLVNLYKYGEKTSPWEELSKEKLEGIEERLSERVKGQPEAIGKIRDVVIRAYTGFAGLQHSAKQKKPKGTLFFVGPTGVGKTELAKALAEFVFGDESACIRFDMSEFNHEHSDQRLVGAPPGYVGYEAGGQLTNAVRERPFCVLLFDEIEKAHAKILDKFLQILEDGRLTDGKGETVSFSETIIIFTSNIGAATIKNDSDSEKTREKFVIAVKDKFIRDMQRPELLNRIGDNVVAFNFISDNAVFTQIVRLKFKNVQNFVRERYHAKLLFEDENGSLKFIASKTDKSNGGRGVLNEMEGLLVNPLSEFVFHNEERLSSSSTIRILLVPSQNPQFFDFKLE